MYPYNQFTASIFKMSEMDERYRKYVVGLSPINITHQGESLGYSECFTDYINEIIEEYRRKYSDEKIKIIILIVLVILEKQNRKFMNIYLVL